MIAKKIVMTRIHKLRRNNSRCLAAVRVIDTVYVRACDLVCIKERRGKQRKKEREKQRETPNEKNATNEARKQEKVITLISNNRYMHTLQFEMQEAGIVMWQQVKVLLRNAIEKVLFRNARKSPTPQVKKKSCSALLEKVLFRFARKSPVPLC
jgi:hypothetical protein